jgi:predicted DNA-binding transcriptional regulator AlpA
MIMLTLDGIADGADLAGLGHDEAVSFLLRLAAAQTRLAATMADRKDQPADHLLDVDEAAAALGETRAWLYRRTKTLPFVVRLGGQVRYSARGIEHFIARRGR